MLSVPVCTKIYTKTKCGRWSALEQLWVGAVSASSAPADTWCIFDTWAHSWQPEHRETSRLPPAGQNATWRPNWRLEALGIACHCLLLATSKETEVNKLSGRDRPLWVVDQVEELNLCCIWVFVEEGIGGGRLCSVGENWGGGSCFCPGSGYPGGAGAWQVVLCALQVGQAAIAPGVK